MDKIKRKIYLDKIIKVMKNDFPLFKNMRDYGFYDQLLTREINYILSGIFGKPVRVGGLKIYDEYGYIIYHEDSNGYWIKYEYDEYGKLIYYENSDGKWWKKEYDKNGNRIYSENYNGEWEKSKYDEYGNRIYYEDSYGNWLKSEYDENGNILYSEDSNGLIRDNRGKIWIR